MPAQLERDPSRALPRMMPAQLTHQRLHLRRRLMRTTQRPPRPVLQTGETHLGIPGQPGMNRLPGHPNPGRHLNHRFAGLHGEDRPIPLLNDRQLHQRNPGLPSPR